MTKPVTPKQSLGSIDGAALIFSNVVGVGIFTTSGLVLKSVPDTNYFLFIWLVGGLIALIGAFAYARLSEMFPQSGGEYVYLSKVFGPLAGFLTGWTSLIAGFSGAIAASAVGFAAYLTSLLALDAGMQSSIAVILIVLTSALHAANVRVGSTLNYGLCLLIITAVGIVALATLFYSGDYEPTYLNPEETGMSIWMMAFIPIMFSYSGWNAAVYVAEEIREPAKNMRRILIMGTLAVITLYLLMNFLYIKLIPGGEMSGTVQVGDLLARKLLGPSGAWIITGIILIALVSSVSAMIMAGPRIYFAMARDGLFPKRIQQLHPRFNTPVSAIVIQSLWSITLVVSGSFEQILIYTGFAIILFSAVSVLALLVIKWRSGRFYTIGNIPYAFFILLSIAVVLGAIEAQPIPSLIGMFIISLGVPLYFLLKPATPDGAWLVNSDQVKNRPR